MRRWLTLCILWLPVLANGQYGIAGYMQPCLNDVVTYTVMGSPQPNSYSWAVTGGYVINTSGASASIGWITPGAGSISVTLYDAGGNVIGNPSSQVTVHDMPQPVLTTDFTNACIIYEEREGQIVPVISPDDCWHVCENSTVHYFVNPVNTGSIFTWNVAGAQVVTQISANEIEVYWGGAGNGLVTVTETNANGCVNTAEKCVKIIESPRAIITAMPEGADCREGGSITVCLEQEALFFGNAALGNSNSPIVSWLWDFGNPNDPNNYSAHQSVTHFWTTPGTYYVTLTVTNACNCSGTCTIEVIVEPLTGVNIECPAPVCTGDTGRYYTDALCNNFNWTVSGGNIISPQPYGSMIQVVWTSTGGNGFICLDNTNGECGNHCPSITCVEIPIITPNSSIIGPVTVCKGSQILYSVPAMTGSIYTWSISGINANILFGQGTNEIMVEWPEKGIAVIEVDYHNAFLDCGGRANLTVTVSEGFSITGPEKGCVNGDIKLEAVNPDNIVFDWTVTDANGQVTYVGSNTGVPDFNITNWSNGPGVFIITATDPSGNYCNTTASVSILINEAPPAPDLPQGEDIVCPGSSHLYTAIPDNAAYYLEWTVTDGIPGTASGNELTIGWNAALPHNYSLSLVQIESETGCRSLPSIKNIDEKLYVNPAITGLMTPCINSTETYLISNAGNGVTDYKYDQLEWRILANTAGSVSSGQGTTNATVQWNNQPSPPGIFDVYLQVKTTLCGAEYYHSNHFLQEPHNISLTDAPAITITATPNPVCENVPVQFSVSPVLQGNYTWNFGDGITAGGTNPNHLFNLQQGASTTTFTVTLTIDNAGCNSYASTNVTVNPAPLVIMGFSDPSFCPPLTTQITVTLVQQTGNISYLWSNGSTTHTEVYYHTDAQPFVVTVTNNVSGCQATVPFNIGFCVPNDPCEPTALNISFTHSNVDCITEEFFGTISPLPPVYGWGFGDGTGVTGTLNPVHTYNFAGHFKVCLSAINANNQRYCDYFCDYITIPLAPNFTTAFHCSATPGCYDVEFKDLSTYYQNPITDWEWYDGNTFLGTGSNPTFTLAAGTHQIKLWISNGNDMCERVITILVPAPPDPTFSVSGAPFCEKQTIAHFTANNTNVHHAFWDFGDAASYIPPFPNNTIEAFRVFDAGTFNYTVQLTLTDHYGCTYSSTQQVTVNQNGLGGIIASNPIPLQFCPDQNGIILFDVGLFDPPSSWQWSTGAVTPSIAVNQTGTYTVTVSNNLGCSFTSGPAQSATYNVPQPVIRGDLTLCEGDNLLLNGNQGPSVNYAWTSNPSLTQASSDPWLFNVENITAGTYSVTLTITANSCTRSATVQVIVNPPPPPPDIETHPAHACEGQPVDITVANTGGYWVNWSNGMNGPQITVFNANVYQATMTDANGCTSTASVEVHENPYTGFLMTGCVEQCDTLPVIIYGSHPIEYEKWLWFVNGNLVLNGNNSVVPDLNLGYLTPGVYVIQLLLTVGYPDGTSCETWTEPLELTIKACPCHLEPVGRMYCMEHITGETSTLHNYHFQIWTNYQCSANPNIYVTSPDGGVTLLPNSSPPAYLTGVLSTASVYPQQVCFDIDIIDPLKPDCNCNYRYCMKLPKCPYPEPCGFEMFINDISCIGRDPSGYPVYAFTMTLNPPVYMGVSFAVSGGWLAGMPGAIGPGITVINGTFTDSNPFDGLCIIVQAYDFESFQICYAKVCIDELPSCLERLLMLPYQHSEPVEAGKPAAAVMNHSFAFRLIPNPARDELSIYYQLSTDADIEINDLQGRELWNTKITDAAGLLRLNTAAWLPGLYPVALQQVNGKTFYQKLVIIK